MKSTLNPQPYNITRSMSIDTAARGSYGEEVEPTFCREASAGCATTGSAVWVRSPTAISRTANTPLPVPGA
jgi:hypothetical protein